MEDPRSLTRAEILTIRGQAGLARRRFTRWLQTGAVRERQLPAVRPQPRSAGAAQPLLPPRIGGCDAAAAREARGLAAAHARHRPAGVTRRISEEWGWGNSSITVRSQNSICVRKHGIGEVPVTRDFSLLALRMWPTVNPDVNSDAEVAPPRTARRHPVRECAEPGVGRRIRRLDRTSPCADRDGGM